MLANHSSANCIETTSDNWSHVCEELEVLHLSRTGLAGEKAQRGRFACKQKLIGKVIANIKSADKTLTRIGTSAECYERAQMLPWLAERSALEDGDVLLLHRVPIEYNHLLPTNDSLLSNKQHMQSLFIKRAARGSRWQEKFNNASLPALQRNANGIASSASIVPIHLQTLVRKQSEIRFDRSSVRVSSNLTMRVNLPSPLKHNSVAELFCAPKTVASDVPKSLAGLSETARIESLLLMHSAATEAEILASESGTEKKRSADDSKNYQAEQQRKRRSTESHFLQANSNANVVDATFDSEFFWNNSGTVRKTENGDAQNWSDPPRLYVCNRCGVPGHWLRDCPTRSDKRFDGAKILTTNGIPKQHLKRVQLSDFALKEDISTVTLYRDQEGNFFVKKNDL